MPSRPLFTFALFAYNQEGFINDAVRGALSQTYSPLEIILSDDCSTDGTFAVMQEMASNYKGAHHIVLNRNPQNLGPAGHLNKIIRMSTGELIVFAEGDDTSLPERTAAIYGAWESSGRPAISIYSDYLVIDKSGALWNSENQAKGECGPPFQVERGDLLEFLATWRPMINGCTHACSRRLLQHFGELPRCLKYADIVFAFRSLGINGLLHVNRPLVKYRRHDNNFSFHAADDTLDQKSFAAYDAKRMDLLHGLALSYETMIRDMGALGEIAGHDRQYLAKLELEARRVQLLYLLERQMICEPFPLRLRAMSRILSRGGPRFAAILAPQLLPRRQYHKLRDFKRTIVNHLRNKTGMK
ncbi:MAG: glycosyltransferase [Syntrophobacteraceae bacterium]|nr:glycosyltransferase [Syntrophobacteraceae bacterium]